MEMQQIRYFLAVADKLTSPRRRAVQRDPAVADARDQAARGGVGGPLIHRERNNTHLTELGRMVQSHLEHVYEEAQETKRAARELTGGKKTTLKLGIMCTIAPDQIIELIGSTQGRHPEVGLRLGDANAWDLQKELLEGPSRSRSTAPGGKPEDAPPRHAALSRADPGRDPASTRWRTAHPPGRPQRPALHPPHQCEFAGYADAVWRQNAKCETAYRSERDDGSWRWSPRRRLRLHAGELGAAPRVVGRPMVEPEFWREVNLVTVRGRPYSPGSAPGARGDAHAVVRPDRHRGRSGAGVR